ncbi:unnamed protein product [Rotaria magnacalcarata]|uniref:Uncharacterized protein n=3 Tax=Rotaria magnacalcarata TaxID=392030 RepID=A0A819IGE7_9BILA|nr:unnamed protein product [Rotaria magnacalcarata]CAF2040667.1 unnamed protein product [Rotaria magnacalcarata]CAF2082835.1 unnamed protein product [Rotaria magnacalcarata]CAF2158366.1 unnamed protein product [Rotaria magnacalcarata]CAF3861144.1 unnamed protein product [Rotaria magnacalcarata]
MAIDNELPSVKPLSAFCTSSSSSTSSSLSPFLRQRRLIQVATNNSATFIQFPMNVRQSSSFIPICRPRTSYSSARLSSPSADTQSLSNQSKSSAQDPQSSITSTDHKRGQSERRVNPILNNPLLNHRKEQPKYPLTKCSNESSRPSRPYLPSKPLKSTATTDTQISAIRESTVPPIVNQPEININLSDRLILLTDNKTRELHLQYVDENKYDYITRWLNTVRTATYSTENLHLESKRSMRRIVPS